MLLVAAISLHAQAFTDDFESYTAAAPGINVVAPGSFGPWSVTAGSVDILNGFPGILCRSGAKCIDDGSTNSSGTVQRSFTATAGTQYALTFWYSGSQRGASPSDSMTVTLGTATLAISNIPFTQGFTQGTLAWTAPSSGPAVVQFAYLTGADNSGLIIDDVALTAGVVPVVPVPPTITLFILGLACLGGYYTWRTRGSRGVIT
jgi:hypothetical protein